MKKNKTANIVKHHLMNDRHKLLFNIVEKNLCTGCGLCTVICPNESLKMSLNERGEYNPTLKGDCNGCDLCANVCPVLSENLEDIDVFDCSSFEFKELLGYSNEISAWGGYATNTSRRIESSSGGMLTLILQHLFDYREIDAAVVVGRTEEKSSVLFESKIVRTVEELNSCAGSKYYPIELSKSIKEISKKCENVAIVGLPCHINGISNLVKVSSSLKKRIKYTFGLLCGHGVSSNFTDFLFAAIGADKKTAERIEYRGKMGIRLSSNYEFLVMNKDHRDGKMVSYSNFVVSDQNSA